MSCLRRVKLGEEHHHVHKNHDLQSMLKKNRSNKAYDSHRKAIMRGTLPHEVPAHLTYPGLVKGKQGGPNHMADPEELPPLIRDELLEWRREDNISDDELMVGLPPIMESRQLEGQATSGARGVQDTLK